MCYDSYFFFFFNDTATTEIYTLSLHDALPISLVPAGHQEGDRGGLPGPPRHPRRRSKPKDTPRARHLWPEETPTPASGRHRDAADGLSRPSGLLGPCARERACAVLRGPRHRKVPGLPGPGPVAEQLQSEQP